MLVSLTIFFNILQNVVTFFKMLEQHFSGTYYDWAKHIQVVALVHMLDLGFEFALLATPSVPKRMSF
jgi:hypothetical protein